MTSPLWKPTGWKCATGHVIEMTIQLPAGVTASVRLDHKKPGSWQRRIRRGYDSKFVGRHRSKTLAMQACENDLKVELKSALRMLEK